jgi:hypothetical protein
MANQVKAYIYGTDRDGKNVTETIMIDEVETKLSAAKLERLNRKFNNEVRVNEWVAGVTYYFQHKASNIASSSLEEIWEMYKAAATGQPIPERKCRMIGIQRAKIQ